MCKRAPAQQHSSSMVPGTAPPLAPVVGPSHPALPSHRALPPPTCSSSCTRCCCCASMSALSLYTCLRACSARSSLCQQGRTTQRGHARGGAPTTRPAAHMSPHSPTRSPPALPCLSASPLRPPPPPTHIHSVGTDRIFEPQYREFRMLYQITWYIPSQPRPPPAPARPPPSARAPGVGWGVCVGGGACWGHVNMQLQLG